MHELSIAMSILEFVAEESERRGGAQVTAVHLKLGPLSGVVKEALLSAYDLAREATAQESPAVQQAQLVIEEVPLTVHCARCQCESAVDSLQHMVRGQCGTPSAQVVHGQELEVVALEINA